MRMSKENEKIIKEPSKIVKADSPWVTDQDNGRVMLEFIIQGVEPEKGRLRHKGGVLDVHVDERGESFELRLQFDKKEGVTEYLYNVGKLPSVVVRNEKKVQVHRDIVKVTLQKKDHSVSWCRIIEDTGKLDQSPPPDRQAKKTGEASK